MSYELPEAFWKTFKQEIRDRQPRVFKQFLGGRNIIPQEELFRIVWQEAEAFAPIAGTGARPTIKIFLDKALLTTDTVRYMPTKADGSFEGWCARLRSEGLEQRISLYMNSLQSRSPQLFERYRQFTDGMFAQTGLPPMKVDSDLFAGAYRETFMGVHKDAVDNFAFIAVGLKRMLLWRYEDLVPYVQKGLDVRHQDFLLQIRSHKDLRERAIVLEAEPGDLMYWPGHFWHVAEGTGSISVTNNMAIYLKSSPLSEPFMGRIGQATGPFLDRDHAAAPYSLSSRQEVANAIPESLREVTRGAVQALKELVDGGLEREMELTWLKYVSAGGFQQVPAPAENPSLPDDRLVRLAPYSGLVWRKLSDGQIAVAANGHAACFPESRGLLETLHRLSGGGAHRVGALLGEAPEERQGDAIVWSSAKMKELLLALEAHRAFTQA